MSTTKVTTYTSRGWCNWSCCLGNWFGVNVQLSSKPETFTTESYRR